MNIARHPRHFLVIILAVLVTIAAILLLAASTGHLGGHQLLSLAHGANPNIMYGD